MFGYSNRIVRRIQHHGLEKHETIVFHAGEVDPNAILLLSEHRATEIENQTGTASGFVEFQPASFTYGDIDITFDKEPSETEISCRVLAMQRILTKYFDAPGKNHPGMPSFIGSYSQWSCGYHLRPSAETKVQLIVLVSHSSKIMASPNSLFCTLGGLLFVHAFAG
jgi:hypothetical protein